MPSERDVFKITLNNDIHDLDIVPKRPLCETCIYGTSLFCPESPTTRMHYLRINTSNPILVDVLKAGIPEIIESTTDCPSYIEDPKFKDRNMD